MGEAHPAARSYVLIDAGQVGRFHRAIPQLRKLATLFTLMPGAHTTAQLDAMPHMLALEPHATYERLLHAGLHGQTDDAFGFPGAISWIVSPLQPQDMASRLRARLDALLPDDYRCVNRFFDGRVAPHLHASLSDLQRLRFYSLASQWWVVSHEHRWQSLQCRFSERDDFNAPLVLNAEQEAHMIDACYPYAVIDHFLETAPQLLDDLPPARRYEHFARVLPSAQRFGLDGGPDAILFCTLSLTRGKDFHEHNPWPELLARVSGGDMTLQQAVKAQHD